MKKIILAIILGLSVISVQNVDAKIIKMNGIYYEVIQNPNTNEYKLKPIKKEKVNVTVQTGIVDDTGDFGVVKYEKTKTEKLNIEQHCDIPTGCPTNVDTGDCPDCKEVEVYTEKIVEKIPHNKPIKFERIVSQKKTFSLPDGKYGLVYSETYHQTKIIRRRWAPGIVFIFRGIGDNQYLVKSSGGAKFVNSNNQERIVSCPKANTQLIEVGPQGKQLLTETIKKGTCSSTDKFTKAKVRWELTAIGLRKIKVNQTRKDGSHFKSLIGADDPSMNPVTRTDVFEYKFLNKLEK